MADAGTKLTPQQKIEMACKAIEGTSRGEVNPEGFSGNAVMRGSLMGEIRGRDAVVAALKKVPAMFGNSGKSHMRSWRTTSTSWRSST